jgi:hypothetical protein
MRVKLMAAEGRSYAEEKIRARRKGEGLRNLPL